MNAMAVTNFDRAADPEVFDGWICDVRSAAEAAQGFVAFAASISRDAPLDWAVAVTFESEDLLHRWLDGATWKHLVHGAAARGFLRLTSDLVIVDGAVIPSGVAIVSSSVSGGMEADFQAAHVKLTTAASQFPGYEGTAIFRPGALGQWMSMIRFRTEPQLSAWLRSPQRNEVLPPVRSSLTRDFSVFAKTTTVRYHGAQRGREAADDAELEDGDAPTNGALPHGDADVEIRDTGDRGVGRRAVAVGLARPGDQRGIDAMVADAHGGVMVPPLAGPGGRGPSANQPARRRSSRARLRRVVDHLRDRRGAAVLELTSRIDVHATIPRHSRDTARAPVRLDELVRLVLTEVLGPHGVERHFMVARLCQRLRRLSVPPNRVVKWVESMSTMSPARWAAGGIQISALNSVLPAAVNGCGRFGSTRWRPRTRSPSLSGAVSS